jgi:hypothetical protein
MSPDVGPSLAEANFELSFNPFMRILMTPMLCGPRRCHVRLTAHRLEVSMGMGGWAFSTAIPRSAVTGAARVSGPVMGWGAHGWRGRWLINGSSRGLVRVSIDPAGRGRCLIAPLRVKELTLSLERPDEFIAALSA